jgi:hypothetical protein
MSLEGIEINPHVVGINRVEKTFEHGRVLPIRFFGVSSPLCEPGLGQALHNNGLCIKAHTFWECTSSMGRTLRGEHLDKQPG